MIFDAHVHPFENFFSRRRLSSPGSNLGKPEDLLRLMDDVGMAGAMVLGRDPQQLASYVEQVPHAYGLYWSPPPGPPIPGEPSTLETINRVLDHPKIVGIKLHPLVDSFDPSSPMMDGLYDLARQRDAPILLHTGHEYTSVPWLIGDAARRHPQTRFVMAHMGLMTMAYVDGAIEVAEELANVSVDISGMPFLWKIPEAVTRLGSHRIFYGSDAPFFTPQIEIEKVRMCGVPEAVQERILGQNAVDFYLGGLDVLGVDENFVARPA
ncbi:MAG TPA: amidohydrolase family protein [Pseudolysinimonas sp.]|nr:amidohydrolase family protein [Pseudolysinimonas sp.]